MHWLERIGLKSGTQLMQNSPFACTQAKKHINGDQISDFCVSGGPPSSQIKTEYSIKLKLCMAMSSGGR